MMAAFSNQHHYPLLLDSACLPDTLTEMPILSPQFGDMSIASSCFYYYTSDATIPEVVGARNYESSSFLSQMTYSSSVVVHPFGSERASQVTQGSMEKKRKDTDEACLSSVESKDSKESKNKKQKKTSGGLKEKEEKKLKDTEKKKAKACLEPPTGYIHVRARRGQATDSHSLAERVRREKISERMKVLQRLVPGCDKVTGKALVLDEIINYVQSLQNQVEFLSMKLASVNPILYDFALDLDDHKTQPEERLEGMSHPMPSVFQTNHIETSAFEDATNSLRVMETSVPAVLLHGHGPIAFSQDNGSALMQVGDQRQSFPHQVVFRNMCSSQ